MEVLIKLSDAIKTLKSMAVPLVRKLPSAQPERLTDYSFEESCTECPAYDTENHRCPRFNQVIRTALKDANLEPCENCISRQAAIDALDVLCQEHRYRIPGKRETYSQYNEAWQDALGRAEGAIGNLPSAQPEKRTEKRTEMHACDCIERQAAVDAIYHHLPSVSRTRARTMLHEVPSAQPERKRGKWIERNPQNSDKCRLIECDQCGFSHIVGFNVPYEHWIENRNFCERCGADMREVVKND